MTTLLSLKLWIFLPSLNKIKIGGRNQIEIIVLTIKKVPSFLVKKFQLTFCKYIFLSFTFIVELCFESILEVKCLIPLIRDWLLCLFLYRKYNSWIVINNTWQFEFMQKHFHSLDFFHWKQVTVHYESIETSY